MSAGREVALQACVDCGLQWGPDRINADGICVSCETDGATPSTKVILREEVCSFCHGDGKLYFREEVPR